MSFNPDHQELRQHSQREKLQQSISKSFLAQEVFLKRVNQSLQGIENIETGIDDILVWGWKDDENDRNLIKCLNRVRKIGMTMNISKCIFRQREVMYLGHEVSAEGRKPDDTKIRAISDMTKPIDKKAYRDCWGWLIMLPNSSQIYQKLLRRCETSQGKTPIGIRRLSMMKLSMK